MAKSKSNTRDKSRGKPKGRPWWRGLLRLMVLLPFRYWYLTLLAVLVAVVYWQQETLLSWVNDVITGTLWLFGWGLLFIILPIGTVVWVLWQRKLSSVIYHWNHLLSGIAFSLAAWGILAFLNLGGSFGLDIIGYPTADFSGSLTGILRIVGLAILGTILVAPRACYHLASKSIAWLGRLVAKSVTWLGRLIAKSIAWLGRQRPKQPIPRVTRQPDVLPVEVPPPAPLAIEPVEAKPPRKAAAPERAPVSSQEELKQVAQEVWKKYGESPELVTVDGWRLPPIDILDRSPEVQFSQADNAQRAKLIEEALASYGVEAKVAQINAGPTVTQFGVEPGWDRKMREVKERDKDGNVMSRLEEVSKTRVKVERISSLANDLALALAAPSIRIEAPVPGKSIVGIEVPNTISSMVSLRGVIETSAFQKLQTKSRLSLALGKGAGGEAVAGDLTKMPHLLIAGATGSGKTVCLNSIICCLLLYDTPYEVKFIMIDPKRVELTLFNSIPHLATPVIVDADKAIEALRWLSQEMNQRYQALASVGVRNIESYNKNKPGDKRMPYLILIIDELADLMMAGGDEVERTLCRLAQLARAVGIHLVVATQRPSVDVVTGLIKANFPTRISFAVTSQVDSRTILDIGGAEKLLGSGDMLYMPTEASKPKRLQGCYVSDAEAERLIYFWGNQRQEEATSLKLKIEELSPSLTATRKGNYPEDSLLETARKLAQEHEHISASFLQRRLRIGYPRAARLMEQLEEKRENNEQDGVEL